jgi:FkbM family methyltransferase
MIFDNISSNEKINKWINESYQECKASYPVPEKGGIAFDIGANVGGFCIHAHKKFDKIFAFEPMIENYNILCQTIETLGIKNVEIYNTAVYSESNKTLPLRVYGGSHTKDVTCADFINENIKEIDQQCETISLKDAMGALGLDQLDYLKLDCEGSEYAILENFNDYDKIGWICMEIHSFYGTERKNDLLSRLHKHFHFADIQRSGRFKIKDLFMNIENIESLENLHNLLLINRNIT